MTDGSAQRSALQRALGEARQAHAYADKLENVWLNGDAIESDAGKMHGDRLRDYAAMVRADGNSRAFIVAAELLCAVLERLDGLVESAPADDEPEPLPCGRGSLTCLAEQAKGVRP